MNHALRCVISTCVVVMSVTCAVAGAGSGVTARLPLRIVVPLVTATLPLGLMRAQAGIVVSPDGLIVTQLRAVRGARRLTVAIPGSEPVNARVVGMSDADDLALLKISSLRPLPVPPFADVSPLQIGETVRAFGYPFVVSLGMKDVAEGVGTISRIAGPPVNAFFSDALVNPGFAGGPILDRTGKVVGMTQVTAPGVRRTAWAKSIAGVLPAVERMRRQPLAPISSSDVATVSATREPRVPRQVQIAVHVTLSGPTAAMGRAVRDGAELAVETLAGPIRARGVEVSMLAVDDQGNSETAVSNARRLVADPSVLLVIGHSMSSTSMAAAATYDSAALPMITPAGEVATLTDSDHGSVFRVIGRDDIQGVAAAQFLKERMHGKSAYVIYEPSDYGLRAASGFWWEGQRLDIRMEGLTPVDGTTLNAVVTAIAAAAPDVVYYGGELTGAVPLLKRLRRVGVRAPLMGTDGLDTSEFAYLTGGAMLPAYYTILDGPPEFYPKSAQFIERFRARFGRAPEPFAALAFDAVGAGLEAISRAGRGFATVPARGDVLAALHDPAFRYQGVTGLVQFTPNGDRRHSPVFVMQVRSSEWSRWRQNTAAASLRP
jgi:branched-chain amino acid transport system substrate-binding protein